VVPDFKTALISISTIAANGYSVEFDEEKCTVRKGRTVILEAERNGKLYLLSDYCVGNDESALSVVTDWHLALGHPSVDKLKAISEISPELGIVAKKRQCEACVEGKMRRKNFEDHTSKPKQPMESVHMDTCGPMSTVTYSGGRYFLLLVEAASRYSKAVIISNRSSPLVVKETINFIGAIEKANGKYKV
jgi:GAG-pre-integrase domain